MDQLDLRNELESALAPVVTLLESIADLLGGIDVHLSQIDGGIGAVKLAVDEVAGAVAFYCSD